MKVYCNLTTLIKKGFFFCPCAIRKRTVNCPSDCLLFAYNVGTCNYSPPTRFIFVSDLAVPQRFH